MMTSWINSFISAGKCSLCLSPSDQLVLVELSRYIQQLSMFLLLLPQRSQESCWHPQVARCRLDWWSACFNWWLHGSKLMFQLRMSISGHEMRDFGRVSTLGSPLKFDDWTESHQVITSQHSGRPQSTVFSRSDQLVFGGGVVEVPLVPPAKIPRALLTSPGDPMPVGLTIEMIQLMTSWVKANGASRECPSLAMRCVILALSETWTLNLMIEPRAIKL